MIITLQNRGTITVSREMRKKLGIVPGDPLEVTVENGKLTLTPVSVIPRTLVLSETGKKLEAEADEDIRCGRVRSYANVDDMITYLDEE